MRQSKKVKACEPSLWRLGWSSLWDHEPCEGRKKLGGPSMRALSLGSSVELPWGPRAARGVRQGGVAQVVCGRRHLGLGWSSLSGHVLCEGCAEMGWPGYAGAAIGGLRWSSLWGHEPREGCAEMGWPKIAGAATGALGAAPCGAKNRLMGAPK